MSGRYQEGYCAGHRKGMADCEPEIERLQAERDEMLAVLQKLDALLDFHSPWMDCLCFSDAEGIRAACVEASAVLAKAEGRS